MKIQHGCGATEWWNTNFTWNMGMSRCRRRHSSSEYAGMHGCGG